MQHTHRFPPRDETAMKLLVSIATYRRPHLLADLLASLDRLESAPPFDVLVVDNDAGASARAIAEAAAIQPRYVVEPRAGIAAARNRALSELDHYDAMIFVDDDEYVDPDWLAKLTRHAVDSNAGVVMGPVISDFPSEAPRWIVEGGFIQRQPSAHGARLTTAATNNTLLRRDAWLQAGRPTFDDSYSATGGSDTRFFTLLADAGVVIEFCGDAVVHEIVPPERLRARWVVRRGLRNGVALGRIWTARHGRLWTAARATPWIGLGLLRVGRSMVRDRRLQSASTNTLLAGLGAFSSVMGVRINEYKRH